MNEPMAQLNLSKLSVNLLSISHYLPVCRQENSSYNFIPSTFSSNSNAHGFLHSKQNQMRMSYKCVYDSMVMNLVRNLKRCVTLTGWLGNFVS